MLQTLKIMDLSEQFSGDEGMRNHSSIEESTLQNLEAIISQVTLLRTSKSLASGLSNYICC
jgi:hypothetical protein